MIISLENIFWGLLLSGHFRQALLYVHLHIPFCLFVLMVYTPVNNFLVMSGLFPIFQGLTSTKLRIKCLAQGHNAVPQLSLKPFDLKSDTLPLSHLAPHACAIHFKQWTHSPVVTTLLWLTVRAQLVHMCELVWPRNPFLLFFIFIQWRDTNLEQL